MNDYDLETYFGPSRFIDINTMTAHGRIKTLRQESAALDNGPLLRKLQLHTVQLMQEDRMAPLEDLDLTLEEYDTLINDISPEQLEHIGTELQHRSLTPALVSDIAFPVHGIIYGRGKRHFVTLVVAKRTTFLHVNFLYDSGSPQTYLQPNTLRALGYTESIPADPVVSIHGRPIDVRVSIDKRFSYLDVLGQDYMSAVGAQLLCDFRRQVWSIHQVLPGKPKVTTCTIQ